MARPSKKQQAEAAKADAPKVIDVDNFVRVRDSVRFVLSVPFMPGALPVTHRTLLSLGPLFSLLFRIAFYRIRTRVFLSLSRSL